MRVLEFKLSHLSPPQPEPEVNPLWKKVDVFYTVTDWDDKAPMYSTVVPIDLTVQNENGTLSINGVNFGPDAWRVWTENDHYASNYTGRRRRNDYADLSPV